MHGMLTKLNVPSTFFAPMARNAGSAPPLENICSMIFEHLIPPGSFSSSTASNLFEESQQYCSTRSTAFSRGRCPHHAVPRNSMADGNRAAGCHSPLISTRPSRRHSAIYDYSGTCDLSGSKLWISHQSCPASNRGWCGRRCPSICVSYGLGNFSIRNVDNCFCDSISSLKRLVAFERELTIW